MKRTDFIKLIAGKKLYVYGSGYVGRQFVIGLTMIGYEKNIVAYVETNSSANEKDGIKIISVTEIENDEDTLICIATHETLFSEIKGILEMHGLMNYLWVAPLVQLINFGDPIIKNQYVSVSEIIKRETCYNIAIRLLALEEYLGNNKIGYEIYKKFFGYFSNDLTADRRLSQYIQTINSLISRGYDDESVILLNTDYQILDGTHRVALAYHFNIKEIKADIYDTGNRYEKYIADGMMGCEKELKSAGMTQEEVKAVLEMDYKIKSGTYGVNR